MSLVYITHHDENIFDVEREFQDSGGVKGKSSKYRKHSSNAAAFAKGLRDRLNDEYKKHHIMVQPDGLRLMTSAKKCHHRTMGCAITPIDPPCAYLRKNDGIKWRRENQHVCPPGRPQPPLPRRQAKDEKTDLVPNFVRRNIKCARSMEPCPPPPRYVDTPTGTRHNLHNSGIVPQFICGKNFGKVPVYLQKNKQLVAAAREECNKEEDRLRAMCGFPPRCQADGSKMAMLGQPPGLRPGMRIMQQDERVEILDGLKQHLGEMTKQYQSMPLQMDTVAKRQRKGKLETDLRQVEQDILLIETSPIIYVSQY